MCLGSWDCSCNGPDIECPDCNDRRKIIDASEQFVKIIFDQIYNSDSPNGKIIDDCFDELSGVLGLCQVWPKYENGDFKSFDDIRKQ